jgi:hypothetical protein
MSRHLGRLSIALMLFAPLTTAPSALAQGAPGDNLEVKGQIAANDPADPVRMKPAKIHEIKLAKGKAYQIDLSSGEFDTFLRLVNAAGVEVASDDDSGGNLNSRVKYTSDSDDTYKIYVTSFAGGTGNYVLRVQGPGVGGVGKGGAGEQLLNVAGNIQPTDAPDPVRRNPGKVHEVKFKKGMTYQIDLMSKNFDAFLRLEDDAGKEVAKDDDGAGDGTLNSRIKHTAEKDATYKIFATTFDGGDGNYTLVVRSLGGAGAGPAGAIELPGPTAAKPAQSVGQLQMTDPNDPVRNRPAKLYTVELKAGKTYVLDLMSNQFDCFLRLENPEGKQLAQDDDGGEGLNSRIRFQCTADGRYRIYAAALVNGQGQFTLIVTEQP